MLPASAYTRHGDAGRPAADRAARPRARCSTSSTAARPSCCRACTATGSRSAPWSPSSSSRSGTRARPTPTSRRRGPRASRCTGQPRRLRLPDPRQQGLGGARAPGRAGPSSQTVVLEPGVSMYLPTGTPHAARAQDTVSLHVTIGINQVTWKDVLDRALAGALDEAGAQHLPAGYLDDPSLLADGLADPARDAGRGAARPRPGGGRRRRGAPVPDRPHALAARRAARPDRRRATSPTTPRSGAGAGHPCVLRPEGDRLRVLLGDRELLVPGAPRPPCAAIRCGPPPRSLRPTSTSTSRAGWCCAGAWCARGCSKSSR